MNSMGKFHNGQKGRPETSMNREDGFGRSFEQGSWQRVDPFAG